MPHSWSRRLRLKERTGAIVNGPVQKVCSMMQRMCLRARRVAGAIYRFNLYGWDFDKAYKEMKNYDFSSGLVHGALKSYVVKYADRMKSNPVNTSAGLNASKANQ